MILIADKFMSNQILIIPIIPAKTRNPVSTTNSGFRIKPGMTFWEFFTNSSIIS